MVAPKSSGVCPITSGAPAGGAAASLKGALCTRRCVQILAGATAIGVLGYVIYSYATAGSEVKASSGQKPAKKGGKSKRKRRSHSSELPEAPSPVILGGCDSDPTSSSSSSAPSGGGKKRQRPADSRKRVTTPRK